MQFLGPVGKGIEGVNKYHLSANGQRIVTDLISSYSYWGTASSMTDVIRVFEEKIQFYGRRMSSDWVQIGQNLTSAGEEEASFAISADGNRVAIVEELGGDLVYTEGGSSSSDCPRAIIRVWDYHDEKKEWVQVGGVIDLLHFRKVDDDRICVCLGVVSLSFSADGNRLAIQLFQRVEPFSWYDVDSCYRIDVYQFQDGSSNLEEANWTPLGSTLKETCSASRFYSRRPLTVRMSGNGDRLSICNEVLEMYYFDGDNFRLKHSWEVHADCNMDLNHDGTMIVFQSSRFEVSIWNVVEGIEVAFIDITYPYSVKSVSMDSVGKLVVVGANEEELYLWNGTKWSSFASKCDEYPFSSSIVLSKDGNRIATRYYGYRSNYKARVTLFDIQESKEVERVNCAVIPDREIKPDLALILSIAIEVAVGLFLFVFAKIWGNRATARGQGQGNDQEQQQQEQGQEGTVNMENFCLDASGGGCGDDKRERLLVKLQSKQKVFVVRYIEWGDNNNNKEGKLAVFAQQPGENGESIGGWLDVDDSCTICLEPYEVNQEVCFAINSACIHYFHLECMLKWLVDHKKCPMCYATYLEDADENTKYA
jgi:RING-finger-containing ubiquitin ligase